MVPTKISFTTKKVGGKTAKGSLLVEIFYKGFELNNNGVLIVTNGSDDNTAFELGSGGLGISA